MLQEEETAGRGELQAMQQQLQTRDTQLAKCRYSTDSCLFTDKSIVHSIEIW